MIIPSKLPDIRRAKLPSTYVAAKDALAECSKVDECKEWSNKAQALASYAKQAGDKSLFNLAVKIKARAIRRSGQLLKEIEPGKTGPKVKGGHPPLTRKQAGEGAGMSDDQRKQALRVATVPDDEFEEAVEADEPATVTELAERGTKKQEAMISDENYHPLFSEATIMLGRLRDLAVFAGEHDPADIVGAVKKHELPTALSNVDIARRWFAELEIELQKKEEKE